MSTATTTLPYGAMNPADAPYARDVDQAAATFESAKARLFRSDGQQVYGPAEHQSREHELIEQFDAKVLPLIGIKEGHLADAEKAHLAVQRDPLQTLDSVELGRANGLQAFFREDFESLPLDELADRLKSVLARGNKPELALALRYGARRIAAEREKHPAVVGTGEGARMNTERHPQAGALHMLGSALDELTTLLAPKDLAKKEEALATARRELNALRRYASNTRDRISGEADRRMAQMRAHIGGRL